jgi:hypothetical protein
MIWTFLRYAAMAAGWIVMIGTSWISSPASAQSLSNVLVARMKDANQWPMVARDYANTRYSELDQINTSNASQLQLAWTFSVGADRGQEAAPLIIDGTMYVVGPYDGPYPNRVFALDATTGELKWSYAPPPEPAAKGVACCDVVNRGLAYDQGKIFLNTLDDHTVAIDAKTGKELWHSELGEINRGETVTMAPVVVRGKVLVGNSGGAEKGPATFFGDPKRGMALIKQYGCGGCHLIPEIADATGNVGPPLLHVGSRTYIAGFISNSPENMSLWIQHPQKTLPGKCHAANGPHAAGLARHHSVSLHLAIASRFLLTDRIAG